MKEGDAVFIQLRDAKLALLTGSDSEAMALFDGFAEGIGKAKAKGYSGMDAEIYYKSIDGEHRWIFYLDEFHTFLCSKIYWDPMEKACRVPDDRISKTMPDFDAMRESSLITALLFKRSFDAPEFDFPLESAKPAKAEEYQIAQIQTYLERYLKQSI